MFNITKMTKKNKNWEDSERIEKGHFIVLKLVRQVLASSAPISTVDRAWLGAPFGFALFQLAHRFVFFGGATLLLLKVWSKFNNVFKYL